MSAKRVALSSREAILCPVDAFFCLLIAVLVQTVIPKWANRSEEESGESTETSDEAGGVDGGSGAGVSWCGWVDHSSAGRHGSTGGA